MVTDSTKKERIFLQITLEKDVNICAKKRTISDTFTTSKVISLVDLISECSSREGPEDISLN